MTANGFGEWLTAMTRGLGFRQDAQIARALNVSPSTVGRWRRGSRPSVQELVTISRAFGVGLEPLLVISGLVERSELSNGQPPKPPQPVSVATRHILDAPIGDAAKTRLFDFWEARMDEEHERLYQLIDEFRQSKADAGRMLSDYGRSDIARHVYDAVTGGAS